MNKEKMIDNLQFIAQQESASITITQDGCKEILDYITNLEQENEDLKITKAGQQATIEILKEENENLKGIAILRKDTLLMNQKKVDKLQDRIDKAIEYIKSFGNDVDRKNYSLYFNEIINKVLNILTGGDEE